VKGFTLLRGFFFGILFGIALFIAGGYFLLEHGYVDFGADHPPSATEAKVAMGAVDAWADRDAGDRKNPLPASEENITAGATLYLNHCAGCHGVPSNPASQFQRSFYPPAPGFFREMPDMEDASTFYVIQRGIRWTGMPAWNSTLSDQQIWQIVVFFDNMHKLPPSAVKVFQPAAQNQTNSK
jgi:mono/diheme cytochrome c family protein